ncbi:hypothetical protein VTP01DRAFT_3535 [Rhizomucor pusillus]|uniref:uncharacterized protein n=1 Tax=Rhizomucor pusillus TaxID=4840 RepID=UPI00374253F5
MFYPEVGYRIETFHAKHVFTRKFCGCMSLRGGCAFACALWVGIDLYVAILAYQTRNPIFSYLDYYAFMVMGTISLIFVVTAFFGLFALFVDSPYLIHFAHRITWVAVSLFLTNFFADIIIFSVQEQQYQNWCSNKSRDSVDEAVTTEAGVHVAATLIVEAVSDYYNCHKLWQDELKLAIAMFIVMTICYIYWATCLWSYAQKLLTVNREAATALARGPPPPPPPPPLHPPVPPTVLNLAPSASEEYATRDMKDQDQGQSAAQIARRLVSSLFQKGW